MDGKSAPSDLDKYYLACVVGGPGAFIQVARGFADFARAIKHKLVLELSSNPSLGVAVVKVAAQAAPGRAQPAPAAAIGAATSAAEI